MLLAGLASLGRASALKGPVSLGSTSLALGRPGLLGACFSSSAGDVPAGDRSGEGAADAAAAAAAAAAEAAAASASSAEDLGASYSSLVPKVVVFGGSGYVGSRVCQHGLEMGLQVTSVSRHGRPAHLASAAWADSVEWVKGDALDPQQPWRDLLKGSLGVVSTLGAFGSNDFMYKVCGTANMQLMDAAVEAGIPRFAFISVHDYKFPAGWHAQDFLLRGYFQGKRDAEAHMAQVFPGGGVALRPGFIYGSRALASGASIPLGAVGAPLASLLKALPTHSLASVPIIGAVFVPPVSVDAVAKAALTAVVDPSVPPGVMDVWTIAKYG